MAAITRVGLGGSAAAYLPFLAKAGSTHAVPVLSLTAYASRSTSLIAQAAPTVSLTASAARRTSLTLRVLPTEER